MSFGNFEIHEFSSCSQLNTVTENVTDFRNVAALVPRLFHQSQQDNIVERASTFFGVDGGGRLTRQSYLILHIDGSTVAH